MRYVKKVSLWVGEKVKFVKNFFQSVGILAKVWRWLVGGLNCFKAAEHGGDSRQYTFTIRNRAEGETMLF